MLTRTPRGLPCYAHQRPACRPLPEAQGSLPRRATTAYSPGGPLLRTAPGVPYMYRGTPGDDAVWCIDPPTFSARWPDFFARTKQLPWMHELPPWEGRPRAAPHWRYRTRNSLGWDCASITLTPRPEPSPACARMQSAAQAPPHLPPRVRRTGSWTNCDLPGIIGLLRFLPSSTVASTKWLWTLDWDVGWTGNLAGILGSFAGAPHDFLAGGAPHVADKASWTYFGLRSHLRDDEVWQTLVVPQRFSMRMVRAIDQAVSAGQHSFCEMRSPSLCQQQHSWCLQAGMAELQPSALGEFDCCNTITEEQLVQRQQAWSAAPQDAIRSPGQLLHRIRDSGKVSASALFRPHAHHSRRAGGRARGGRSGKKRHHRRQQQKTKRTKQGQTTKKAQKKAKQHAEHAARVRGGVKTADLAVPPDARSAKTGKRSTRKTDRQ